MFMVITKETLTPQINRCEGRTHSSEALVILLSQPNIRTPRAGNAFLEALTKMPVGTFDALTVELPERYQGLIDQHFNSGIFFDYGQFDGLTFPVNYAIKHGKPVYAVDPPLTEFQARAFGTYGHWDKLANKGAERVMHLASEEMHPFLMALLLQRDSKRRK